MKIITLELKSVITQRMWKRKTEEEDKKEKEEDSDDNKNTIRKKRGRKDLITIFIKLIIRNFLIMSFTVLL